jgi:transcriptional regulator with XRE-family HTH domain
MMMSVDIQERIGRRLREAREQQGWTQELVGWHVSRLTGSKPWSKATVSQAEAGRRAFVAEDLLVIALVFNKRIAWFFGLGDTATAIDEVDQVRARSGHILPEQTIAQAVGRPRQDARRLAQQLRAVADEVEAIYPAEEGSG